MNDAELFVATLERARKSHAKGDLESAARYYSQATALWPSRDSIRPLADLPRTRLMLQHRDNLLAQRREAVEAYARTQLRLGRHTPKVADEILQAIRVQPTNTRLWRLRILALYRAGYRGEALKAHEAARTLFEAEVQAGPGSDLDRLHTQVLEDDPILWSDIVIEESPFERTP